MEFMEKFLLRFDDFKKQKTLEIKDKIFDIDSEVEVLKQSDLRVSFKAVRYGEIISITGVVFGTETFECARCLKIFKKEVNTGFECSFAQEDVEFDLGDEIKQTVMLDLPMQPLCFEECRGLCHVCGCNKNEQNCNCQEKLNTEFIAEKWSKIKKINSK